MSTDYKAILREQREGFKKELAASERQKEVAERMLDRLKADIQSSTDLKELKEYGERLVRFADGVNEINENISRLESQIKESNNWNI